MSGKKVLFELTEDHLDTGLRGVPTGTCTTSQVDPIKGLSYRGYYIDKLAYKDPEEVIYLLLYGELPTSEEMKKFREKMASYQLSPLMIDHLNSLPKDGHPMKWFLSAINFLGMVQSKKNWLEDCLQVIALVPEIVAHIYRIRSGWGDPIASKPEMGYMENFIHMLSPPNQSEGLLKLMRFFDILHFDHGGGNLSTFVGKVTASGLADMYESLVSAMAGLAGPLHGKANQECLSFLKECHNRLENPEDEKEIETLLKNMINGGEKVFGFGHAVLRVEDPRATVEYAVGQEIASDDPLFKLALNLRTIGVKVLSQFEKIQSPYPNVDAVSGSLLNAMGLEDEEFYTILFGMSRCVGIACQIYVERVVARNGKGLPITRPKFIYTGPIRN